MKRIVFIVILFLFSIKGKGQEVKGVVKSYETNEPIPFASVWIKDTFQGVSSNNEGRFILANPIGDTLCISSTGYEKKEFIIKKNENTFIDVILQKSVQQIGEIVVKPETPIARRLFYEIIRHKKENRERIRQVTNYKTLENTAVYLALDSVGRAANNLEDITVKLDNHSMRFSPIYLKEKAGNISNDSAGVVFEKKDGIFPRINTAIESVILNNVIVDMDFYKDQIFIMERGFISPLNNSALQFYNLYFNDSIVIDEQKFYRFTFTPKNRFNPLFTGNFTVEAGSFALTEINVYISKEANLNFVNGFQGNVKYKKLPEGNWFFDKQRIQINMSLTLNKDTASMYVSERVDNVEKGNWLINRVTQYSNSSKLDMVRLAEWKNQPEFAIEKLEADTYARVDKLKENKVVKAIDAIGGVALTGFFNLGKIDIGPMFDIYSTNLIEGSRFSIPVRTSERLFDNFSVGGFLGFGTKDKELKYGANVIYRPMPTDRLLLKFYYSNDYTLLALDRFSRFVKYNPNYKGTSNFIAALTAREHNPYLKKEESYELRVEFNAKNDIHLEASPYLLLNKNTPHVQFIKEGTEYKEYKDYGVLFNMRIPFGQHYDRFFFDRVYYLGRKPIINFSWNIGQALLPDAKIRNSGIYSHFHGSAHGRIVMGQVFMNYLVNCGFLFGDAPYDLLDQPVGSMSIGYSKYNFNLLHYNAFAHNLYTNTHFHINGGGIILNHIPLVRKLKLREVVSFKGHYGNLTSSYKGVFDLPDYYTTESNPYCEIGVGLTNIFKVLRVEYVRSFGNFSNNDFINKHGIFLRAEMSF